MSIEAPYRIVIVDDHSVVRDLIAVQLGRVRAGHFQVVASVASGEEALTACLKFRPNLVLLDLMLPGLNGFEVLKRLKARLPRLRVLLFSGVAQSSLISQAIELGIDGFVGKLRPWQIVVEAVEAIEQGKRYFDPSVEHLVGASSAGDTPALTPRERQVVQLIAEANSTKEIASKLGVSVKTVDKHRTSLMDKLGVHDSVAVARFAIQRGIVSLD